MKSEINDDNPELRIVSVLESQVHPLWISAGTGDETTYRQALRLMADALRRYFRRRLSGSGAEAEDLVQETLLAIHVKRGSYNPEFPVTAWMFGIARYKLIDYWRAHGEVGGVTDNIDDIDESDLPSTSDSFSTRRDLDSLLNELPAAQRQAIALTKLEGLSLEEASKHTGVSVSALKVQVHRGLVRLTKAVRGS